MSQISTVLASIATTTDVSGVIPNFAGYKLIGVVFPATMTNTAFTLQTSIGGAWRDVFDETGAAISLAVVDGVALFPPSLAYGLPTEMRLKGAVNEAAARELVILTRTL